MPALNSIRIFFKSLPFRKPLRGFPSWCIYRKRLPKISKFRENKELLNYV